MISYKYVIIGGGLVAGYAARTFAENGESASSQLCILSADSELPYERPALSKQFLAGEESVKDILINEAEFYTRNGIDVHLETAVEQIDFENRHLQAGNDTIGFDNLLIATGAHPKTLPTPGFDLRGIHTLRLVRDARQIQADMQVAGQAVVIGGSFIGMEVGSVLQRRGIQTTIVFPEERVWEALFTPEMSEFFERYYREQGVDFVKGATLERFVGDNGHVARVVLDSGRELPANLVVAGVGVEPAVELVRDSHLQVDNGIVVNRFLETRERGIFAAGDVARYRDPQTDSLRRIEHWDNAKNQGQHAACGMLGMRQEFRHVPYFFSDVFDLSYEFWGDTGNAARAIHRGAVEEGHFSTWWLDEENRLVAAYVMDRPDAERELAPVWIREHTRLMPDILVLGESIQGAAAVAGRL